MAVLAVAATSLTSLAGPAAPSYADGPPLGAVLEPSAADSFRIATFNILGSQHTRGPGGWGPGVKRARMTVKLIRREGIDVVGMQEVQSDQLAVLRRKLAGHTIWPGTALGGGGLRLQIAFRNDRFALLRTGKIITAFDRQRRPVPWVLLRERTTKRKLYVVNLHNSARNLEHERDSATRREIKLVKKLRARGPSVFAIGDTNEHTEWFCKMAARTDLRAPHGGSATPKKCTPPPGRMLIDWIMGGGAFDFTDYGWLSGGLVRRASDHNLVHADVRMRPKVASGLL